MTAHRYWRARIGAGYGGGALALCACWLLAGADRVDDRATLAASRAPDAGALATLQGHAPGPASAVRWNVQDNSSNGSNGAQLILTWTLDTPQEVTDIRLGAGAQVQDFPAWVQLDYADENPDDDQAWARYADFAAIVWPGAWQLTRSTTRELAGPLVYADAWASTPAGTAPTDLTLFGDTTPSLSVKDGTLTVAATSSGFARARLDACPPMDNFEVAFNFSGASPALAFHQNYWSNAASSLAWHVYRYGNTLYVGKGTGTDTGKVADVASASFSGDALCVRVAGGQLKVYAARVAGVAPVITQTLDAFTGAGQFGLGASGGSATFRDLRIRRLYPTGTYIDCLPGGAIARALPPLARAMSRAALPPLAVRALPPIARMRPNYVLNTNAGNQTGRVRGRVEHKDVPHNTPVHRRVRLFRSRDGLLVRQLWSDAVTGDYDFQWVEADQVYTVIAEDYQGHWRAVIADQIAPEAMP